MNLLKQHILLFTGSSSRPFVKLGPNRFSPVMIAAIFRKLDIIFSETARIGWREKS